MAAPSLEQGHFRQSPYEARWGKDKQLKRVLNGSSILQEPCGLPMRWSQRVWRGFKEEETTLSPAPATVKPPRVPGRPQVPSTRRKPDATLDVGAWRHSARHRPRPRAD